MSDVRTIQTLTSADSVKTKRAYRRGQITKIKAKIKDLWEKWLENFKPMYYRELQRDLSREIELHAALQLQLESVLRANARENDAYHEECSGEEVKRQHAQDFKQILDLISRHQHFKVSATLQEEVDRLDRVTNVATKSLEKSVYKCAEKVAVFRQDTQDLWDDNQIKPLREILEDAVARLHIVVMESQEKSMESPLLPHLLLKKNLVSNSICHSYLENPRTGQTSMTSSTLRFRLAASIWAIERRHVSSWKLWKRRKHNKQSLSIPGEMTATNTSWKL